MAELNHFRTYEIAERGDGTPLELARDGALVVCLGFDTSRGRFVEITALGEGDCGRFLDHAAAVASLSHPAVAPIVDYGSEAEVCFYASDLIDGEPLVEYAARTDSVAPEVVYGWLLELAEGGVGLEAAGLRPRFDNARIVPSGLDSPGVKIVDYGITGPGREPSLGDEFVGLLRGLCNYQRHGDEPVYPPEIEPLCRALEGLDSAARAVDVLRDHRSRAGAGSVEVAGVVRPRLLLERELFRHARPEHVLPERYRPVRRAGGASPYESVVADTEAGRRLRVVVLPPERMVSERMLDVFDNPELEAEVPVGAFWKHEDFRLLAEPLEPGFHLGDWIAARPARRPPQLVALLDAVAGAMAELSASGVRARPLHVEDVVIEFAGLAEADAEMLAGDVSVTRWPDFNVRIRNHPTMLSLTERGDGRIPDGAEDVLAAAERGEPLPVAVVFAWYFNLCNRGLHYQAGELVESLRGVCGGQDADGGAMEGGDAPPAEEVDGAVADGRGDGEDTEGIDDIDETLPALEDGEGDESELPVVGPIAAAMGVVADDDERDGGGEFANPIARQVELAQQPPADPGYDAIPEEGAPRPVRPVEVGELLEEDGAGRSGRSSCLPVVFILIAAIAIAAAVAHLTGRAFWLR